MYIFEKKILKSLTVPWAIQKEIPERTLMGIPGDTSEVYLKKFPKHYCKNARKRATNGMPKNNIRGIFIETMLDAFLSSISEAIV